MSFCSDLTLSQEFQPMAAQLSIKAALPLAKIQVRWLYVAVVKAEGRALASPGGPRVNGVSAERGTSRCGGLRLPPELLRMRTVKDIKVNAFVFVYRSHTYPPCLRWEHLSVHRTLFGFII